MFLALDLDLADHLYKGGLRLVGIRWPYLVGCLALRKKGLSTTCNWRSNQTLMLSDISLLGERLLHAHHLTCQVLVSTVILGDRTLR